MTHWVPLAERLRPSSIEQYAGQKHLIAKGKPLELALRAGHLHSMILWGPPGTGKTTLAKMCATYFDAEFISLSAVLSGVKDIREAIERAEKSKHSVFEKKRTVLFIDEIHRFNKSQQDSLLPHVENGTVTLIGATTENPSFALNNALLSRARVYVLKNLDVEDLVLLLKRAIESISRQVDDKYLTEIAMRADGDARRALNILDMITTHIDEDTPISDEIMNELMLSGPRRFDKKGEYFYDQISALHKAVRGSDADGALYWLTVMMESGCDRLYLLRRMIRMAVEDIGNADLHALKVTNLAAETYERLGSPEGDLALVQAILYLSAAPKSNAVYTAYHKVRADVEAHGTLEVPLHIRNAPTDLMKSLGYGKDYEYSHDSQNPYAQQYLPEKLLGKQYYEPRMSGLEIKIKEKLDHIRQVRYPHTIEED